MSETPLVDAQAVVGYGEGGIESSYGFRCVPIADAREIEFMLIKALAALSAAEQRAGAMRKDFERQLSVRMPDPHSSDLVCPVCHERDFDAEGLAMHFTHYRCAALAAGKSAEGEAK